jgi:hypothetical protein
MVITYYTLWLGTRKPLWKGFLKDFGSAKKEVAALEYNVANL